MSRDRFDEADDARESAWKRLERELPEEHRELLCRTLLARLDSGWGTVEIVVEDHHIKSLRDAHSIQMRRPTGERR